MRDLTLLLLIGSLLFAVAFSAMAIGIIVRGKRLRSGCGGEHDDGKKDPAGCGFCAEKKKTNICSAENKTPLRDISLLGTLSRYEKDERQNPSKKT